MISLSCGDLVSVFVIMAQSGMLILRNVMQSIRTLSKTQLSLVFLPSGFCFVVVLFEDNFFVRISGILRLSKVDDINNTLMDTLSKRFGEANSFMLTEQYRMNKKIMELVAHLFWNSNCSF